MLPVAVAAMPTLQCQCQCQWQSQGRARGRARRRRRRPGDAEAAKIPTVPGGLGALQAPQGAPETKHKHVMGATAVFACAFFAFSVTLMTVKYTLM